MNERPLLPGEYMVLSLLAIREMHGYEMVAYVAEAGLDAVCPVEQSTLYTYLRNVEARSYVVWSEERVGQRPPRKTYALTPTGRECVDRWLRQPVDRMREVRLEFLLKLYFLREVDRPAHDRLLAEQIAACRAYLADLGDGSQGSAFARLVGHSKRSAAEATLGWLSDYANECRVRVPAL